MLFCFNYLHYRVDKEDEMECLIKGCNFLLKNIPDESFLYQRHGNPEYKFQTMESDSVFPFLLVNIGSGVSMFKVSSGQMFSKTVHKYKLVILQVVKYYIYHIHFMAAYLAPDSAAIFVLQEKLSTTHVGLPEAINRQC